MGIAIRNTTYQGWLGGWNTKKAPNQLAPYELSDILNMHYDSQGAMLRRDGSRRKNATALTSTNAEFYGLYEYRNQLNTTIMPIVLGASGTKIRVWDNNTKEWLITGTATNLDSSTVVLDTTVGNDWITDNKIVSFVTFVSGNNNIAIFTDDGSSALGKIYLDTTPNPDELTIAALGGSPPKAKHLLIWQGRLWAFNLTNDGAGVAWPSDAWFSAEFNAESGWASSNDIAFDRNDGDEITGACVLSGQLVVFKRKSLWYVTGYGIASFDKESKEKGIGCIAPRSIKVIGEAVYFLSHKGVCRFSFSHGIQLVGNPIQPTFTQTLNQNLTVLYNAIAQHDEVLKQYILWCPNGSATTNNLALIYTYRDELSETADEEDVISQGSWTQYSGTGLIAQSACEIEGALSAQKELWIGSADGFARVLKTGNKDDVTSAGTGGSDITSYITTSWLDFGQPNMLKRLLKLYPMGAQNVSYGISLDVATDFSTSFSTQASIIFTGAQTTTPVWDTAVWDQFEWANPTNVFTPVKREIGVRVPQAHRVRARLRNVGGTAPWYFHSLGAEYQYVQAG